LTLFRTDDTGRGELDAVQPPGMHASDIGVEHCVPLPECERGHCRRGVIADTGQRAQIADVRGDLAAERVSTLD
jgi:hypothetical protein